MIEITKKHLWRWNYGLKFKQKPTYIILHHTASMSAGGTWAWFNRKDTFVSAHYTVDRDGSIWELVPPTHVAWHAGVSGWGHLEWMNDYAIGIEIVSPWESYTDYQGYEVRNLVQHLAQVYQISPENILRHTDITQYDKGRLKRKELARDDDNYNKSHSRKWDVGRNLFEWMSFDEYRRSIYKDPVIEFGESFGMVNMSKSEAPSRYDMVQMLYSYHNKYHDRR